MGLLTIIRKQKLKEKEIKCLVLGLDNSGKSTLVNKLLPSNEQAEGISPTVGFQIHTIEYSSANEHYQVTLWDVGGQTTLRPFWDNYFDKTDVLVWCIDANLSIRFDESFNELKSFLLQDKDRIGHSCEVIVAMNKIDLLAERTKLDLIKSSITAQLENATPLTFIKCSAITGEGLNDLLSSIVATRKRWEVKIPTSGTMSLSKD